MAYTKVFKNRELNSFVLLAANKKLLLCFNVCKFSVILLANEITFKRCLFTQLIDLFFQDTYIKRFNASTLNRDSAVVIGHCWGRQKIG